jgi:spore maturation protein CgeB
MATKTVGMNRHVPQLGDMFEDGKHMIFWYNYEDCLEKINKILNDNEKQIFISEEGYKLYKEKYTLTKALEQMFGKINET